MSSDVPSMRSDRPVFDPQLARGMSPLFAGLKVGEFGCGLGEFTQALSCTACHAFGADDTPGFMNAIPGPIKHRFREVNFREPLWLGTSFDWVFCLQAAPLGVPAWFADNLDRHTSDGVILNVPDEKQAAEVEAAFARIGYATDDSMRDDLREAASLTEYKQGIIVLRRRKGTPRFLALFIGGPLHRQEIDLNGFPVEHWHKPEIDPAVSFGLYAGNTATKYRRLEWLVDRGVDLPGRGRFLVSYIYEG